VVNGNAAKETFGASSVTSVFALAGFLGLVVALVPYRLSAAQAVPSAVAHFAPGRVASFAADIDQGAIGVVMIGDSRLRYGTRSDRSMSTRLSAAVGTDVTVMRLAGPGATFADFEPVAEAIVDAEPRLVILQEDLLLRIDTIPNEVSGRNAVLWNVVGGDLWNPMGNMRPLDQDWEVCPAGGLTELPSDEAITAILRAQELSGLEYRSTGAHVQEVESFVERARSSGVDVVALSIPETEAAIASIARTSGATTGAIDTLPVAADIPDDAYCDPAHLSPAGRDRFVDALIPAVADRVGRS